MARKNSNAKKGGNRLRRKVQDMERMAFSNLQAMNEGPSRKNWTQHDLRNIKPLTETQKDMFHHFFQGQNVCAHGSAGTGKTFLALYLALNEVFNKDTPQDKVVIVRSPVSTREIGHMPGDLDEKIAYYETPYIDICAELLGRRNSYHDLKAAGKLEFMVTTNVRGLTWDDSVVVVDEGQNMNFHEINSVMTRMGVNTRILFTGDIPQTDLRKTSRDQSGMEDFLNIINRMSSFASIEFTYHDIVRSEFVKEWIMASEGVI